MHSTAWVELHMLHFPDRRNFLFDDDGVAKSGFLLGKRPFIKYFQIMSWFLLYSVDRRKTDGQCRIDFSICVQIIAFLSIANVNWDPSKLGTFFYGPFGISCNDDLLVVHSNSPDLRSWGPIINDVLLCWCQQPVLMLHAWSSLERKPTCESSVWFQRCRLPKSILTYCGVVLCHWHSGFSFYQGETRFMPHARF